jgi:hypothetical protein
VDRAFRPVVTVVVFVVRGSGESSAADVSEQQRTGCVESSDGRVAD